MEATILLYKLKQKWRFRYFFLVEFGIILLINIIFSAVLYTIAGPNTLYWNAYYFFIKGFWIPGFFLAIVDVSISTMKLYFQEHDFSLILEEMTDLLGIAVLGILLLFWSPTNSNRFLRVLLDVPNMIMNNTETLQTTQFPVLTQDEVHNTRSGKEHIYHYYVVIDFNDYLLSEELRDENFNQMVNDYMEDELNGRKQSLDKGYYEITYLPLSRCILSITFHKT